MDSTLLSRVCGLLLSAFLLHGCESLQSSDNFLGVITPYRVEVNIFY